MKNVKHVPNKDTAARYGVTTRTIDRWGNDDELGFPKPIVINGRNYYPQDLEWEAGRVEGVRRGNVIAFGARAITGRRALCRSSRHPGVGPDRSAASRARDR